MVIKRLSKILLIVSSVILFGIMMLTALDVSLRWLFNSPITGTFELIQVMLALLFFLSLPYTTSEKAHIEVDTVFNLLPSIVKLVITFVISLLSMGFFILVLMSMVMMTEEYYLDDVISGILHLPLFPVVFIMSLALMIHFLVLVYDLYMIRGNKK